MTETIWYLAGVLFILVGIAVSIALHELGHLLPAKAFGVKVTKYMIGFGPTLFSRKVGDTEYGIKAIPLGGYIAMIGMFPPAKPNKIIRWKFWRQMVESARLGQVEQFGPDEPKRNFYQLAVYKRIIVMLGGPTMNLLLGAVFMIIALVGIGQQTSTTALVQISQCVAAGDVSKPCQPSDPNSPAELAGLKAGDVITAVEGVPVKFWVEVAPLIADKTGKPVALTVLRSGKTLQLSVTPVLAMRAVLDPKTGQPILDANGKTVLKMQPYIGLVLGLGYMPRTVGEALTVSGDAVTQTARLVLNLPQQVSKIAVSTFTGGTRAADGPISIIGVGQIAGQVASNEKVTLQDKLRSGFGILSSLNFALFVFNLIPLLPLDGGHVAGGIYEAIKRGFFRLMRKPDPGAADTSMMVPVTTLVWLLLIGISLLFIVADLVNPINIGL